MSKVLFVVGNLSAAENASAINQMRDITKLNIVEIKERIMDKFPVGEYVLFDDHYKDTIKKIKQWIVLADKVKLKIYEINEEDDFASMNDLASYEIDSQTLLVAISEYDN